MGTTAPKRNAQNFVSLAGAARAAGYSGTWSTKEDAVDDVARGITVKMGGQDIVFGSAGIGQADLNASLEFVIFDPAPPGRLRYTDDTQP